MPSIKNPLPECPSTPNCKKATFIVEHDSSSVFVAFEEALNSMNAETISKSENSSQIDAVFKIPIFGYRDDVTVLIQPEGSSSQIYIRSASREGHWDIWVNTIRVHRLIKNVKKNLSN
ncbi:MAG: hypothetical protein BalsKO_05460 [Balneolaceae bacterium]